MGYVCCVALMVCTVILFNGWKNEAPHGAACTKIDEFLSVGINLGEL